MGRSILAHAFFMGSTCNPGAEPSMPSNPRSFSFCICVSFGFDPNLTAFLMIPLNDFGSFAWALRKLSEPAVVDKNVLLFIV